jgi:hypothetical protein
LQVDERYNCKKINAIRGKKMNAIRYMMSVVAVAVATATLATSCRSNNVGAMSTSSSDEAESAIGRVPTRLQAVNGDVSGSPVADGTNDVSGSPVAAVANDICNSPVAAMPTAVVYRVNGAFVDKVAVTMSVNRKQIVSYPAPSDVSEATLPIQLADGYLLDRRGINMNSVFTKYSYKEYGELPIAPSLSELREMVIPGAIVTDLVRLPMTLSAAVADTARVNELIRAGFPGCTVIVSHRAPGPYLK